MVKLKHVLRAVGLFGFATMSACMQLGDPSPVRSLAVLENAVNLKAPSGYCFDLEVSEPAKGFAVLAGCGSVIADVSRMNPPGIATIQIGDKGSAIVGEQENALVDFLGSESGAQLLGAKPDETWGKGGIVGMHFADGGDFDVAGIQDGEWRVFVDRGDRLITIRLRSSYLNPVATDRGYAILTSIAQGIEG